MAVKIRKLKLENCFQHRSLSEDFSDFTVIVGENGSGKSNMLWSLLYCLGCRFALPGTNDSMITEGEDKGKVTVELEHEGETVELRAALGKSNRGLKRGDFKLTARADVEEYVEQALLGVPVDIITHSSVIMQDKLTEGLFTSTAERMKSFMRLAGLLDIETKRKLLEDEKNKCNIPMLTLNIDETKSKIKSMEDDIAAKQTSIKAFEETFDETKYELMKSLIEKAKNIESARAALKEAVDTHAEFSEIVKQIKFSIGETSTRLNSHREKVKELKVQADKANVAISAYAKAKSDWDKFTKCVKEIAELETKLSELTDPGEYSGPDIAELNNLYNEAVAEQNTHNRDIKSMQVLDGKAVCPTCNQSVDPEHISIALAKAKKAFAEATVIVEEVKKERLAAEKQKRDHEDKVELYRTTKNKLKLQLSTQIAARDVLGEVHEPKAVSEDSKVIKEYDAAVLKVENLERDLAELKDTLQDAVANESKYAGKIEELEASAGETVDTEKVFEAKDYVKTETERKEANSEIIGEVRALASQLAKERETLDKLLQDQEKAKLLKRYVDYIEFARTALHRNNFPAGRIKAFIDRMLVQTNVYLDIMQSGFSISYDNTVGFTAHFNDDGKAMRADRLSGGEKIIFALAFRFSVNELRSDTGFLILDEPTVYLDELHIDRVVEALALVKTKLVPRVQTIVVTHDERLMAVADSVIRLRKGKHD